MISGSIKDQPILSNTDVYEQPVIVATGQDFPLFKMVHQRYEVPLKLDIPEEIGTKLVERAGPLYLTTQET